MLAKHFKRSHQSSIFFSLGETVGLAAPQKYESHQKETFKAAFSRWRSSRFITFISNYFQFFFYGFIKASVYFGIIFFSQQVLELPCTSHSLNHLKTLQSMRAS